MSWKYPKTEKPCRDCGTPFVGGPTARWGKCCLWKHRGGWRDGRRQRKYVWTPERDEIVRARYDSHVRGRAAEIGQALGWPGWAVKKRAQELGLCRPRAPWQSWTREEEQFLESHAGDRRVEWIAKKLRRSLSSVILKLKRMHISRRIRTGYGMRDLEECLGLDHRRIARLVAEGKLKARHDSEHHRDRWVFTDEDVRKFVRTYPTAFRLDRVDQLWFLDLVFGGAIGNAERVA